MRAIICDACGKKVQQCTEIKADLVHCGSYGSWRALYISGDYCQKCTDRISLFMADLKGIEVDDFGLKALKKENEADDDRA